MIISCSNNFIQEWKLAFTSKANQHFKAQLLIVLQAEISSVLRRRKKILNTKILDIFFGKKTGKKVL